MKGAQLYKKIFSFGVLLSLLSILMPHSAGAQSTANFTISSFDADYYLSVDAKNVPTMRVQEVITAQFPSYNQNHGILRALPLSYKQQPLDAQIQSVTNLAGQAQPYTTSTQNDNLVLKIGDASTYVHDTQVYKINYTEKNVISFYNDHDEFYWDINGDQWAQPMDVVTARIHITGSVAAALQERQQCFMGSYGSNAQNCTISRDTANGTTTVTTTASAVGPHQTLTVVLGFNTGVFAVDKAARTAYVARVIVGVGLLLGIPLVTLIGVIRKWRKFGRDPRGKGTIIPEYVPPKDLNTLSSEVILHEKLSTKAMTALIIELAIKKYLAIYEIQKDKLLGGKKTAGYELELTKSPSDLGKDEKTLIAMIFGATAEVGQRVSLTTLKNKLYTDYGKLAKSVPVDLYEAGYFTNNPIKVTRKYLTVGFIALAGGLGLLIILANVSAFLITPGIGLMISGVILLGAAGRMPARSGKGVESREYLLGLEMYMKLAEADRIKYLQSPEGVKQFGDPAAPETKIKLFEKLLPYAMLFGIEEQWAKEFKDIYAEPPDWYHGNWSTFNTVFLINSLNSFSTANVTSFSSPASSSSSGFGGGGFSGGGGGGGGGGGW